MNIECYEVEVEFREVPHRGAPFTFDGVHHLNGGQLIEALVSYYKGQGLKFDGNGRFDEGADIKALEASVKSPKASLTTCYLGDTFEEILEEYFKRDASKLYIWGMLEARLLTLYEMNALEFREFIKAWSYFQESDKRVRFKSASKKMRAWLEARA